MCNPTCDQLLRNRAISVAVKTRSWRSISFHPYVALRHSHSWQRVRCLGLDYIVLQRHHTLDCDCLGMQWAPSIASMLTPINFFF